jgi:S1-C subfamily serine protease
MMKSLIKHKILALLLLLPFLGFYFKKHIAYNFLSGKVFKITDNLGSATGFQVRYKDKLYLITNHHVCKPMIPQIIVKTDAKGRRYMELEITHERAKDIKANGVATEILYLDNMNDVCILKPVSTEALSLGTIQRFEPIFITGHPLGSTPVVITETSVVHKDCMNLPFLPRKCSPYLELDAQVYPGHSGSPLLDFLGNVVGIVFYRSGVTGRAVPVEDIIRSIETYERSQK